MSNSTLKIYFPGLNGLRFFAAFAVIFTHVELMKKFLGFGSHWLDLNNLEAETPLQAVLNKEVSILSPYIANAGPLGVTMFFVLSGFLITYLLFAERKETGKVDIKQFYIRRILRIWPLYFVLTFLGFFVFPNIEVFRVPIQERFFLMYFNENLILFLLFLPNLAFSIYRTAIPNIGHLWSIGVEEQFYLIWPWVITKAKNFLRTIVIFIFIIVAIKALILLLSAFVNANWLVVLKKFMAMSKLECMAIGALGAYYLFHENKKVLDFIYKPWVFVLSILIILFGLLVIPMRIQDGAHLLYSVCFLIVILNVSSNPRSLVNFEYPIFSFLGKISYGIYMYHMAVAAFVLHLARDTWKFGMDLKPLESLIVYSCVLLITILVATVSYYLIELPFIRRKKKVSSILSGDNAK